MICAKKILTKSCIKTFQHGEKFNYFVLKKNAVYLVNMKHVDIAK